MSNRENHPDWGMFGSSAKNTEPPTKGAAQNSQDENGGTRKDSMSDERYTLHLKYSVAPDGTKGLEIEPDDTETDKQRASDWVKREGLRAALNTPEGERFWLSGKRDSLTAVIEMARCSAARLDDPHSVWAALEWLASRQEPPLLGFCDDGINIKYRNGGETAIFTYKKLKLRLERREKKVS